MSYESINNRASLAHGASTNGLAADVQSLNRLKFQAGKQSPESIKETAKQFESLFMRELMKSMRTASIKSGMLDNPGSDLGTDLLDQQFAVQMSGQPRGLGEMIEKQLLADRSKALGTSEADASSTAPVDVTSFKPNRVLGSFTPTVTQSTLKALAESISGSNPDSELDSEGGLSLQASPALNTLGKTRFLPTDQKVASASGSANTIASAVAPTTPTRSTTKSAGNEATGVTVHQLAPVTITAKHNRSATQRQADFVHKHADAANKAAQASGIPASFMLGQAGHETGWGRHEIKVKGGASAHNLFGIKAGPSWKGKVAEVTTTEYVNGVAEKKVARFRAYSSYEESFKDYARLINENPRYAQAKSQTGSVQAFANGLQKAGYATDPHYAAKLSRAINTTLQLRRVQT